MLPGQRPEAHVVLEADNTSPVHVLQNIGGVSSHWLLSSCYSRFAKRAAVAIVAMHWHFDDSACRVSGVDVRPEKGEFGILVQCSTVDLLDVASEERSAAKEEIGEGELRKKRGKQGLLLLPEPTSWRWVQLGTSQRNPTAA